MHRLHRISKILLIVCLSACQTPQVRDLPQKNLRLVLDVDETTGRRYINEQESACFQRFYKHSKGYIGPIGQESRLDVIECNDTIGYGATEYVELLDFFEEVRIEINKAEQLLNERP